VRAWHKAAFRAGEAAMLKSNSRYIRNANLIGGEWVSADSGATITVDNPATGEIIGSVPQSGKAETRRAIAAAKAAFATFSKTTANQRAAWLRAMHQYMLDNSQELAEILTMEMGKPLAEAKGEIAIGAAYLLWFAEEARRIYGEVVPSPWGDRRVLTTLEPVGVVAAITPWNFPSSMLARKIGPAIAAGCTSVIKPASQTPYSGIAWGMIAEAAGLPKGVMNIVTGKASEIGEELCTNPDVAKITFTGSTEVGIKLMQMAAGTVKKCSMELGGNAPFIVFNSADIDRAVAGAMAAKYRNSGQTCVCANRFLVQSGVYDAFCAKLAEAANALKVGNGLEDGVQQGPLIDAKAAKATEEFVADAVAKGGRVIAGGKRHALGGSFFEPTVIADATPGMRFAREEIFGPVSPVFKFETEAEALHMANDTEFGLACYFYTQDLGQTVRVMEGLKYGIVGVNEGIVTTPEAPFGGVKQSGLGSEGGSQGIHEYLSTKYICIGGLGL
jgi:succinate-semialdehyde dehydrogenase / glutarate-semialdehyde dehydrogenase